MPHYNDIWWDAVTPYSVRHNKGKFTQCRYHFVQIICQIAKHIFVIIWTGKLETTSVSRAKVLFRYFDNLSFCAVTAIFYCIIGGSVAYVLYLERHLVLTSIQETSTELPDTAKLRHDVGEA